MTSKPCTQSVSGVFKLISETLDMKGFQLFPIKSINMIQLILMGGQNYKFIFHMIAFNKQSLTNLLTSVGFGEVKVWVPGCDELTPLNDASSFEIEANGKTYPISLNLEAVKVLNL